MKAFYINLKKRPDRRKRFEARIKNLSAFDFERWEAIDGSLIQPPKKFKYTGRHYAILTVIKDIILFAKNNNLQEVAIFEDDVVFANDFDSRVVRAFNALPSDWQILYFGFCPVGKPEYYFNEVVSQIEGCVGCFSFMIHSNAYDILLESLKNAKMPVDDIFMSKAHPQLNIFVTHPFCCRIEDDWSDIEQKYRTLSTIRKFYKSDFNASQAKAIPKIIHQIWLGDAPMSKYIDQWREMNPTFEHKIWTEENLPELRNEKHFNSYSNYHASLHCGRADILRLEVLEKYGGIYIDADCVPLRPLTDDLLEHDSWAVYENEIERPNLVANGIVGATKNNLLMSLLLNEIRLLTSVHSSEAWEVTGPKLFADTIKKFEYRGIKIFPSYYFLPTHYTGAKVSTNGFKPYSEHVWGTTTGDWGVNKDVSNEETLVRGQPTYYNFTPKKAVR